MRKTIILVSSVGAMMVAGCVVREEPPHRRVYVAPEPVVVAPAPAPVVVEEGPPPGYVEVIPSSPGPEWIYVHPHWEWDREHHRRWRDGYYVRR